MTAILFRPQCVKIIMTVWMIFNSDSHKINDFNSENSVEVITNGKAILLKEMES